MSYSLTATPGPSHGPSLGANLTFATPQFNVPQFSAGGIPALPPTPSFTMPPPPQFASTPVFGFNYSAPPVASIPNVLLPDHQSSGVGVVGATAKVFLKDELPPQMKTVGVVASAAMAGHKLANNIQLAEDAGVPKTQAIVCQTVGTLSEELTGKVLKGAVVGGLPPYFAAAATNPALALTVPVVVPLVPSAYQGAQMVAHAVGNAATSGCNNAFEMARQLSQTGGK